MPDLAHIRASLLRQARHWTQAAARLGRLDEMAAPEAWHRLERYLADTDDLVQVVVDAVTEAGGPRASAAAPIEALP